MAEYSFLIQMRDGVSAPSKQAENAIEGLSNAASQAEGALTGVGRSRSALVGTARELMSVNRLIRSSAALIGVSFGINSIAQFSNELINVEQQVSSLFSGEGTDTEAMSRNVMQLSTVYGVDLNDAIQAASISMQAFGVDGLAEINAVLAKGVPQNFLADIREFAPIFANAGVSLDGMLGGLATATREGLASEFSEAITNVYEAINNPSAKANNLLQSLGFDTKSVRNDLQNNRMQIEDVLVDIAAKTKNLVGSDKAKIINELFGGKEKTLDLFSALETGIEGLENRTTDAARAQQTLLIAWSDFKIMIAENVVPAMVQLVGWVKENQIGLLNLTKIIAGVAVGVYSIRTAISAVATTKEIVGGLVGVWQDYKNGLGLAKIAQAAFNIVATANPIGLIVVGVAAAGAAIYALIAYWDELKHYLIGAAEMMWKMNPLSWLINAVDYVIPFKKTFIDTTKSIVDGFAQIGDYIATNFKSILVDTFSFLTFGLTDAIAGAYNQMDKHTEAQKQKTWNEANQLYNSIQGMGKDEQVAAIRRQAGLLGLNATQLSDNQILAGISQFANIKDATSGKALIATSFGSDKSKTTQNNQPQKTWANNGVSSGIAEVRADGAKAVNLTINIAKFQDEFIVNTQTINQSAQQVRDIINSYMLESINDINRM